MNKSLRFKAYIDMNKMLWINYPINTNNKNLLKRVVIKQGKLLNNKQLIFVNF